MTETVVKPATTSGTTGTHCKAGISCFTPISTKMTGIKTINQNNDSSSSIQTILSNILNRRPITMSPAICRALIGYIPGSVITTNANAPVVSQYKESVARPPATTQNSIASIPLSSSPVLLAVTYPIMATMIGISCNIITIATRNVATIGEPALYNASLRRNV